MSVSDRSYKEERVRSVALAYYSRQDVRKAMFDFSESRECVPKYYEGFGKRPDSFQFESDILELVKKGATSFHCSEELWQDPLEISTELSRADFDELRMGWDLLLDIDSPYLEYSKIYTELLIETLKFYGVDNVGVKFSGSKGFHVIVPWKAFPKEIYGKGTKDLFPEWPRIICQFLGYVIKPRLVNRIFDNESIKDLAVKTGRSEDDLIVNECKSCNRPTVKKYLVSWRCPYCKIEKTGILKNKRTLKCPECGKELFEVSRKEIFVCEYCGFDSVKNPEFFGKPIEKTEGLIDADLVLVAPRHLFRMPYSLHEKTALASVVIDKENVERFQISDARPFKVTVKDYYPNPRPDEAKQLLLEALDWFEQKESVEKMVQERAQVKKEENSFMDPEKSKSKKEGFKKIVIPDPSPEIFPPHISLLLKGVKQDGRKRALFILITFFKSLGVSDTDLEKRIFDWNERNYNPLKKGYIQSQLSWFKRNPSVLPPNFSNPIYKDLGVDKPDDFSRGLKNPVNYAVKKYFHLRR